MSPGEWPRPRVVVSACLGFAAVRYSGELIPDKVVAALKEHVDFVPVCPEVEIGLGVPRPVVRLVRGEEGPRMVQPKTGEDLTERMRAFSQRFLQGLGEVEGFLLKNRSPSCALKDAKRYAHAEGGGVVGKGPGLFAQAVEEAFLAVNVRTTLVLGQARGVILLAGAQAGVVTNDRETKHTSARTPLSAGESRCDAAARSPWW